MPVIIEQDCIGESSSSGGLRLFLDHMSSGESSSSGGLRLFLDHMSPGGSSTSGGSLGIIRHLKCQLSGSSTSSGAVSLGAVPEGYIRFYYNSTYVDIKARYEKGISMPESYEIWPPIINTYLDGSQGSQFKGFIRRMEISLGVVADRADRLKLLYWLIDNNRKIGYGSHTQIACVPADAEGYENEWIEDISLARKYVFNLEESSVRTSFPVYS